MSLSLTKEFVQIGVPKSVLPNIKPVIISTDPNPTHRLVPYVADAVRFCATPAPALANTLNMVVAGRPVALFRGLRRRNEYDVPILPDLPESTYKHARDYIDVNGTEKPEDEPIWVYTLQEALKHTLPWNKNECGLLLVYLTNHVEVPADWKTKGHRPPYDESWASLHVGTIQLNFDL